MPTFSDDEIRFMKLALSEAKKSSGEDDRDSPFVGVVITKGNEILSSAYRGKGIPGMHAEFSALNELEGKDINGSVVYVTLEPCTKRGPDKTPCAERLANAGVSRVVIGMLDPNPEISGRGQQYLVDNKIETALFEHTIAAEVRKLNRNFIARFSPRSRVLSNREEVQIQLYATLRAVRYRPRRVAQIIVNSNPIAIDSDFLRKCSSRDCDVFRAIVIYDSADIYFAQRSLDLAANFTSFSQKLLFAPELGTTLPSTINVTVIDDHVLITCPFGSGEIHPPWRYLSVSSSSAGYGNTTGIHVRDNLASEVFNDYLRQLGRLFDTLRENNTMPDSVFLEHVKHRLLDVDKYCKPSVEGLVRYLWGFAIALRTEVNYSSILKERIKFLGIVGSMVYCLKNISSGKVRIDRPNDVDFLIVVDNLTGEAYAELQRIFEDLCDTYSLKNVLDLRPEFHTCPAKPIGSQSWMPVQVIIQTIEWLNTCGVPYIYAHRRTHHITLYGQFPDITHLFTFTAEDVLNGEDGIRHCLADLKRGISKGFLLKSPDSGSNVFRVEHDLEMDTRSLVGFAWYSLHWTLVNLARAQPPVPRLRYVSRKTDSEVLIALVGKHFPGDILAIAEKLLDRTWRKLESEDDLQKLLKDGVRDVVCEILQEIIKILEPQCIDHHRGPSE